jgi:prepilin-type N-terminal cleavage/methylation domain-containing protein
MMWHSAMTVRRRERGLTLIELLMTIAIVGLLMVALIVYLLPSDDRRVRNEAERMAAYLEAAGAEAVMRDGPVRVAFDFDTQKYAREVARVGADLHETPFEEDASAPGKTVRAPVRLTTVLLPAVGDLTSGNAWLLWKGRETDGGVAILELNQAVWSVIVDPNNGQVRVERGRASIPKRGNDFARPRFQAGLPAFGDGGVGELPPGALAMGQPPPTPVEDPPFVPPAHDSPTEGAGGGAPPEPPAEPPPEEPTDPPPTPSPEPDPPPDPPVDAGVEPPDAAPPPECTTDSECTKPLERCINQKCVFDPSGLTYRLREAHPPPGAPEKLASLFTQYVDPAIRLGQFSLIVKLDQFLSGAPGPDSPLSAWLVQGTPGSGGGGVMAYMPAPDLPSFRGVAQPRPTGCPPGARCYDIHPMNPLDQLQLYIHNPIAGAQQCQYQKLSVVASVTLTLYVDGASPQPRASVSVQGGLTEQEARKTRVNLDGQSMTLYRLFHDANLPLQNDTNGDGIADAWNLQFMGDAEPIELNGEDPSSKQSMKPARCD